MKHRFGRECINLLKDAYRDGTVFPDRYAIRDYLIKQTGAKPKQIDTRNACDWDRQARLENADDGMTNTFPGARVRYARDPLADAATRTDSYKTDLRYSATRVANSSRLLDANARQADATAVDIKRSERMKMARVILAYLVGEDE